MTIAYHITLTDNAKEHIQRLLNKEAGSAFRLSIKKTGCSGFSYAPSIVQKPAALDVMLPNVADFPIYIDAAYADLLQELQIDLIEENATGLKQKKLVFTNPKESGRCGCGESFHFANEE